MPEPTAPDVDLKGRVALVTGASRGIGAAVAKAYAKAGAHVIALARSKDNLERLDDEIKAAGGNVTLMPFDLMKLDELEALGPLIDNKFGRLDIFVANAGILGTLTPIAHSKMKDWRDTYTLNVLANVQLIRTLDPLLRASDAGRAIFLGTGLGVNPTAYFGQYGATKAAVMHMARIYAEETRETNLRVNIVRPGAVKTDMLDQAFPGGLQGKNVRMPDELAPLFLHLASRDLSAHGELFDIDQFQS